jgi:peptide/nickel transport system ATP-binding protein
MQGWMSCPIRGFGGGHEMSLLRVQDLSVTFATTRQIVQAVRGISFAVEANERVGLVGESGSGKTTAALALMRMIKPPGRISAGTAHLDKIDLLALKGNEIREARLRTLSYIPQGAMNALNPVLRIREQMLDGLIDHGVLLDRSAADDAVAQALDGVDLPHRVADMFAHQLSGGMKQRVCIAIAIMLDPRLIIADEPTSALDVISQRQVMKTLDDVQQRLGCGLILIGHDMGLMAQVTDRVIVMRRGLIVENAPTWRLFATPAHAYSRELISSVPSLSGRIEQAPTEPDALVVANPPLIALDQIGKAFGGGLLHGKAKTALHPMSLAIAKDAPRIIAVVGQSGSGKTTLARMILGLETPSTGSIQYRGTAYAALGSAQRLDFRRDVQAIFQDPYASFNPFYRVDRALIQPMLRFGIARSHDDARQAARQACVGVGLDPDEVLGRFPHELSGGQRQRLMVARALTLKPALIVADEPVSMVDASLRMSILASLSGLRREHGISIIYITHDLATAYQISDEVIVLHAGRIVEYGPPCEVIAKPQHPYTRALVAAIPWPDPMLDWPEITDTMTKGWDTEPVI